MIRVTSWGVAGSVVDGGVPGRAWLGAARGGAVDRSSLALANRLVGNVEQAAAFESSGGLAITVDTATMVALTGAVAELVVTGGPPVGWGSPVALPAGATLRIARLSEGARNYLAVRGGVVGADSHWAAGDDPGTPAAEHAAPRRPPATEIVVWPGPRVDWFSDDAWTQLCSGTFTVTTTSPVGTRLSGPRLERSRHDELPSEGMVEGAVQVPPDGQPIVMLSGHPATGGYPVIAVVDPAYVAHVAQAAPGTELRFRSSSPRPGT